MTEIIDAFIISLLLLVATLAAIATVAVVMGMMAGIFSPVFTAIKLKSELGMRNATGWTKTQELSVLAISIAFLALVLVLK